MALLITFPAANAEIAGKGLNNKTPAFLESLILEVTIVY